MEEQTDKVVIYLCHITTKPVWVSDQVSHKLGCIRPQKLVRGLKFQIMEEGLHYREVTLYNAFFWVHRIRLPYNSGAQFEGDLGEILALGAEILPCIDLREKWESP